MGWFSVRVGAGAALLLVGTSVLPGTARAAAAEPAHRTVSAGPASGTGAQRAGVCRSGALHVAAGLDATATVCVRYRNGSWIGSGQLVLKARDTVSGALSWGPRYYPTRPSLFVGIRYFTLQAGQTVTYPLTGQAEAEASDTGADWEVWVGVQNGIRATGFEGWLVSPVAGRTPSRDTPSRFAGTTRWTCSSRPVSGQGLSGSATLCVRQLRDQLLSRVSLTYTSPDVADVGVGLVVDGATVAGTNVPVDATLTGRRTVTLPTIVVRARAQDRTAATSVQLGAAAQLSRSIPVR